MSLLSQLCQEQLLNLIENETGIMNDVVRLIGAYSVTLKHLEGYMGLNMNVYEKDNFHYLGVYDMKHRFLKDDVLIASHIYWADLNNQIRWRHILIKVESLYIYRYCEQPSRDKIIHDTPAEWTISSDLETVLKQGMAMDAFQLFLKNQKNKTQLI